MVPFPVRPMFLSMILASGSFVLAQDSASEMAVPEIRGTGADREMRIFGQLVPPDGQALGETELKVHYRSQGRKQELPVTREGDHYETWVPIGGNHWFGVTLSAECPDDKLRKVEGIRMEWLRHAATHGLDLHLAPAERPVQIRVTQSGTPIAGAHVELQLGGSGHCTDVTDGDGSATFHLTEEDKLSQVTAWTDDFRLGGFALYRKPYRDPYGTEFTVELHNGHDQLIRFVDVETGRPAARVMFRLIVGTGEPNFQFLSNGDTLPPSVMTTDENGEAMFRWFPEWEKHGAYVELDDSTYYRAGNDYFPENADDGALLQKVKRSTTKRQTLHGRIECKETSPEGMMVRLSSFQAEEPGRVDALVAFADSEGNFTAECLPGATYGITVSDAEWASPSIDRMAYDPVTKFSPKVILEASSGEPVKIVLTSGPARKPMAHQGVSVKPVHEMTWLEGGEIRTGSALQNFWLFADENGVIQTQAVAGSELELNVYVDLEEGKWRSGEIKHWVTKGGENTIHIHRP